MRRAFASALALLLALGMILQLAACGTPGSIQPDEPADIAPAQTPALSAAPSPEDIPSVLISEIMPSNKATLELGGTFPDWIELYNAGADAVELSSIRFCRGGRDAALPALTLGAGEYAVVFCGVREDGAPCTDLSIPKEGAELRLETERGTLIDELEYPSCESDSSIVRTADGGCEISAHPSPGFENGLAGYKRWQETLECSSPLQISEAMVYNEWYAVPRKGCFDWVELRNVSDGEILLSDYCLSDSDKEPDAFRLPERTLGSGECVVIYCTGGDDLSQDNFAPFALGADNDRIYLTGPDGALADWAVLKDIPYGGSYGRMDGERGFFYFTSPTPGAANAGGLCGVADKPVLSGSDGVFNGVESVTVELSAQGAIRYTLDGSVPTESSALYEGPLTLEATAVVRAVSFEEGSVASEPLNLSFIINENHSLPVVSLMGDPEKLMGRNGTYNSLKKRIETPGAVEFFEEDGSFSIACGVRLHGETSIRASEKRSMKLCFRSRYDGELNYDLFDNGVTEFASILLRYPVESNNSTIMRDNLIHQMAIRAFPALPAMDYKYSVLYINGRYWGIYNIREAHSTTHYANHYGHDESTVTMWKRLWQRNTDIGGVCQFALYNDLSKDENYEYVAAHLDVDSIIGWIILQAWCANIDCNPSNVRYYYSTEDGMFRYALSDLDLGMFAYNAFDVPFYGSVNSGVHTNYDYNILTRNLMSNRQFQLRLAEALSYALSGPISDDNVVEMIDSFYAELRPEIPRDRVRWYGSLGVEQNVAAWEKMVDELRNYTKAYGGRASQIINSFLPYADKLTAEEIDRLFGKLLQTG